MLQIIFHFRGKHNVAKIPQLISHSLDLVIIGDVQPTRIGDCPFVISAMSQEINDVFNA